MSVLTKSLHPDEKIKAGKLGSNMTKAGAGVAAVFLIVSVVLGAMQGDHWKRFLHAYVVGWSFIASIAIGMLWLILLHFLVRGRWVTVVRRLAEAMTGAFPLIWIAGLAFVVPVVLGYKDLYYWASPDAHNATLNPTLQHKLGWLSPSFWAIRYVVYGAIFIGLASYFAKKSREQDESGDPAITDRLRVVSGPGMIIYGFTTCALAFDVLMSLAPRWYSTIYGVMFWG
jgi:hypothetical protein